MVHRQYAEHIVLGLDVQYLLQHFRVAGEVPMGEHRAFGHSGGPGGIDDDTGGGIREILRQRRCGGQGCGLGYFPDIVLGQVPLMR